MGPRIANCWLLVKEGGRSMNHTALRWLLLAALATVLPPSTSGQSSLPGQAHGLLVGVNAYDHADLQELRYAEKDVEALAALLDRAGSPYCGKVRVLTCTRGKKCPADRPSAANIRKALKDLLDGRKRGDSVLLVLSGHGVQLLTPDPQGKGPDRADTYFCPSDAQLRGADYQTGRHPNLINLRDTLQELGDCGAGTRLVLVDACRNQLRLRSRALHVRRDMVPEGVAALFSCKTGEVAYEAEKLGHGVFFHYVLEGLRGKAGNKRGEVTWGGLAEYVTEKVAEEAPVLLGEQARQTPQLIANLTGKSPVLVKIDRLAAVRAYERGVALLRGVGEKTDEAEGVKLLRQAEEKGHALARGLLAWCYFWGSGVEKDEPQARQYAAKALHAVTALANAGDAEAQYLLGTFSRDGTGGKKDNAEAVRWFRKAADKEHVFAMSSLAWMYQQGRGVQKDDKQAVRWYRQAADKEDPGAMTNLGWMYAQGRGVEKDDREAVRWFRKAADKEHVLAMTNLGWMYAQGRGVDKNDREAVRWFRKAADKKNARAMGCLAGMCSMGRGGARDDAEATRWLRKAADSGDVESMFWLAVRHEKGQGIARDDGEAARWYRQAANLGHKGAQAALKRLGL
jgi:TPR repeat protein